MYSKKIKSFLALTEKIPPRRILPALGLILLIIAQFYFERREPIGAHITDAVIWNAVYKLEIVNFDNVWFALPFLFGGFLLWLLFGDLQWKESTIEHANANNINWANIIPQIFLIAALYGYLMVRLTQQHNTILEPILWIFTLAWLTWLIWDWDKHNTDLSPDFNAADLTTILILLTIGIALGSFALTDLPRQIVPDEIPFLQASRVIALGEYNGSFFDVGVFTFPLSTSLFQSWVMRIFGVNFWSWRFSSVLAGVAAVIPLYLLARNWFDRRVAFAAGLFMLVNPYFLSFSRFGYNNIQALFPVTLAIYLWEKGVRKHSVFYLWLGGLAAGLGYYSFFAAWIGAVTIGLSIFYLRFQKQISWKQVLGFLAVLMIAFALMAAPRVAFALGSGRSDALVFKVFQASFINAFYGHSYYADSDLTRVYPLIPVGKDQLIFFNPQIYWELFVRGAVRTFLAIFDPHIATEHFLVSGFAGVITPIFFIIGFVLSLKNRKQYRAGLLLLWFLSGTLFLSILDAFPPRQTHLVAIIPVLAIFNALGLISTIDQIFRQDLMRKITTFLFLLVIVFFSLQAFFIKLPITYPADFENQSAWIVRRNDKPATIIDASSTENQHLVRSLARLKITPDQYQSVPVKTTAQVTGAYANTPTLVFYESKDESILREVQKMGFRAQAVYKNKDILGYVFTNTAMDINPATDPYAELILLLKSPALIVIGILLGVLGIHSKIIRLKKKAI